MGNNNGYKLGLALSGGGFRSALFHIGILARLAELDLLRKIDVISSTSGGSIIAAYLFLKVKQLLEKTPTPHRGAPGREAYIQMVSEIETDFLLAVQKNIRFRTYIDPIKNAQMLASEYSNTERLAELLTTYFYLPIFQKNGQNIHSDRILLRNISITPLDGNLLSDTRVPFLIINSTSLNTGHLWQFTNASVGEQQISGTPGNDSIAYLKTYRFDDERQPIEKRKILYNITLGQAVAASSCVPGFFEPLKIKNLYEYNRKPITVRLVDGGLLDNQGLLSLFSQNCTHIICSDASDILKLELNPSDQFFNVALRSNDILIDRIRSNSLNELFKYGQKRSALFDLGDIETRDHIFVKNSEKIVHALTRIRTDLDSFTDREADTLMFYGYQLSSIIMQKNGFEMIQTPSPDVWNWRFLNIRDHFLKNDDALKDLLFHLEVGSRQMFKVFLFKRPLPYLIILPVPLLITLLILYQIVQISPVLFWALLLCGVLVLIYSQNQILLKLMDNVSILRTSKHQILKTLITLRLPEPFSYIIAMVSWIQLKIFDRLFLKYGRIRKTPGK